MRTRAKGTERADKPNQDQVVAKFFDQTPEFVTYMDCLGLHLMLAPGVPMPILDTDELRLQRADFIHRFAMRPYDFIRAANPQLPLDEVKKPMNAENNALPRVVLGDQVKEYVIEAIMNGEFQAGDRIVASNLARQLGVSQAPVREALRDLVLLGFLENEPFKGTSVRSFSPKELYEVYAVRAALESLAARLAAERMTDEDVQVLRQTLEEMIHAAQEQDESGMVRLDNYFHETILRISDNQLLFQLWQTLQFGYWTIITARSSSYDLEELARRHEALLEALASHDPQQAALAMRSHIEDLGKP